MKYSEFSKNTVEEIPLPSADFIGRLYMTCLFTGNDRQWVQANVKLSEYAVECGDFDKMVEELQLKCYRETVAGYNDIRIHTILVSECDDVLLHDEYQFGYTSMEADYLIKKASEYSPMGIVRTEKWGGYFGDDQKPGF